MKRVVRELKYVSHPELRTLLSRLNNKKYKFVDPAVEVDEVVFVGSWVKNGVPASWSEFYQYQRKFNKDQTYYNVRLEYHTRSVSDEQEAKQEKSRSKGSRNKRSVSSKDVRGS